MSALDPNKTLVDSTHRASTLLVKDLQAITDGKHNVSPGGCARNPLHIVAECAMVNRFVGTALTTGVINRPSGEEREAHLNSFDTVEKVLAYLDEETNYLLGVLKNLDPDTLGDDTDGPFGRPMTRFMLAALPSTHMMYHDGQLNYVQTLYGDGEVHW